MGRLPAVSGVYIQVRGRDRKGYTDGQFAQCFRLPGKPGMGIQLAHGWAKPRTPARCSVCPRPGIAFPPESHDSTRAGPALSLATMRPLMFSHLLALTGLEASPECNLLQGSDLDTVRRPPQVCYPPHLQARLQGL